MALRDDMSGYEYSTTTCALVADTHAEEARLLDVGAALKWADAECRAAFTEASLELNELYGKIEQLNMRKERIQQVVKDRLDAEDRDATDGTVPCSPELMPGAEDRISAGVDWDARL